MDQTFIIERDITDAVYSYLTDVSFTIVIYGDNDLGRTENCLHTLFINLPTQSSDSVNAEKLLFFIYTT